MGLVQRESIMFLQWPRMDKPNTGSRAVALKIFMTPFQKIGPPWGLPRLSDSTHSFINFMNVRWNSGWWSCSPVCRILWKSKNLQDSTPEC